jgi:NACHT domain
VFINSQQGSPLDVLPCVHDAGFNSYYRQHEPKCLPDTRVDLLRSVMEWADGATNKCIFWLKGMAGTGKSTIARTVAQSFASRERLIASFFFSKGRGDLGHARSFFSTIAIQLATVSPLMRDYICEEVRNQPGIAHQAMFEQWNRLILRPLRKFRERQSFPYFFVLVIDALDECDNQEDIRQILRLFAVTKDLSTIKLRIFVTSRPETPIRLEFRGMSEILYQDLELQKISRSEIEHDISVFLRHELAEIRTLRHLSARWPGEQNVRRLVEKVDCLFIYAATACRFIRGKGMTSPQRRLSQLLEGRAADPSSTQNLDEMYMRILRDSMPGDCSDSDRDEITEQFRQVVGTIIVLFDSPSVASLTELLYQPGSEQEQEGTVQRSLDHLYSVLVVSEDPQVPIQLLHPSFREFLLDQQRCSDRQFWSTKN